MLQGLFDMDKPFGRWMGKLPELVALSLFWFIGCLPIVTILPSCCALFDAISRNTMMDDKGSFRRFFRSFIRELKQGIPLTILWLLMIGVTFYGDWALSVSTSTEGLSFVYKGMLILMVAYLGWLVPLQSRYNHKFVGLHINALKFFVGKLPCTGLMLLISLACIGICFVHFSLAWFLIFAPSVIAVLHSLVVEKAFMQAFPKDYEDGLPVYTEQDRIAIKAIKNAKQEETKNQEEGY